MYAIRRTERFTLADLRGVGKTDRLLRQRAHVGIFRADACCEAMTMISWRAKIRSEKKRHTGSYLTKS